ncbi:hypothetical protein DL546_009917 [Coniochaeta pulveracea]|uniref:Uncharacterized protein n=1 Tax=Coniochaeta pulveracea TaxID=177199 RepID=A0A420Y6X8_9PEZI|nr:hypothetical protein DL546_009917 [Coniochaeta pulveracea]
MASPWDLITPSTPSLTTCSAHEWTFQATDCHICTTYGVMSSSQVPRQVIRAPLAESQAYMNAQAFVSFQSTRVCSLGIRRTTVAARPSRASISRRLPVRCRHCDVSAKDCRCCQVQVSRSECRPSKSGMQPWKKCMASTI